MHGNDEDVPLDFSCKGPTQRTFPGSRDGSHDSIPVAQRRFDMGYIFTNVSVPPLDGGHAGGSVTAPISTTQSKNFKRPQGHSPVHQENGRYGGPFDHLNRPVSARSSRWLSQIQLPRTSPSSALSRSSLSTSYEFDPAVIPASHMYIPMQSAAIPTSPMYSPMQSASIPASPIYSSMQSMAMPIYSPSQSAAIPTSNVDIYSLHPSLSRNGHFLDQRFKPAAMPMTDSSTIDRKSSKQRPFKAYENEILNCDIPPRRSYGMDDPWPSVTQSPVRNPALLGNSTPTASDGGEPSRQRVESTCCRNTSSPKSGPVGNGESSNESGVLMRPFKVVEKAILNCDIPPRRSYGMDDPWPSVTQSPVQNPAFLGNSTPTSSDGGEPSRQRVESTCCRNTSSPKSGPVWNGESSNEETASTKERKRRKLSSPLTDPSDLGVVGSSQVEEGPQNLSSPSKKPRRRKGKPIPEEQKNGAYWVKRKKNNAAAKKSRDTRREKEDLVASKFMDLKAVFDIKCGELADLREHIKTLAMQYKVLEREALLRMTQMQYVIQRVEEISSSCEKCKHPISEITKGH